MNLRCLTAFCALLLSFFGSPVAGASDDMEAYLQQRLQENPQHSDSWRLLGRFYHRQNKPDAANDTFKKSLELDPDNAATHFDFGQLLLSQGDTVRAREHFRRVYEVAPESVYAEKLRKQGHPEPGDLSESTPFQVALYELQDSEQILQAGYEIQTFDSSEELDRRVREFDRELKEEDRGWRFFLETGVLWNSNVTLTPISRQPSNVDAYSFQGILNPEIEWLAWDSEGRRAGPLLRGYFSLNQEDFQSFNLTSFQQGAFYEQDLFWNDVTHIGRFDYVYSVDRLGGDRFGDRHAVTASMTSVLPDLDVIYTYATVSFTQFDTPVIDPAVNSLDGPAYLFGLSRFFRTENPRLPTWSLGADLEHVNAEGDDFRYFGGKIHADATFQLAERLELIPSGNVGFRQYPDFTRTPDRDELTYRLAGRLRYRFTEIWSLSLVVNYDRFASDNLNFDTERWESGVVTTFIY